LKVGHSGRLSSSYENKVLTVRSLAFTQDNVTPHGPTIRAEYTVPTGKKARVGATGGSCLRYTAATTVGLVTLIIRVDVAEPSTVQHLNNTVGHREWASVNSDVVVPAGSSMSIWTRDQSTGGGMSYKSGISILEFDD